MSPETVELLRYGIEHAKDAAVIILPAAITGFFALQAGRRDAKIELAKLRAEQEFVARNKFYDHLKEQQSRIRTSHTQLIDGIEKVLIGFHEGVAKIDVAVLGRDEAEHEKAKALEMMAPMLDTFLYFLRSQARAMQDERDSLLRYYEDHRKEDHAAIEALKGLAFPNEDYFGDRRIDRIREVAFQLIEVNRVIANHGHRALQSDVEAQLQRYFT